VSEILRSLSEFEFSRPAAAAWLWLVAAVAAIALWRSAARRRLLERFAEAPLLQRIAPTTSAARPMVRIALAVAAMALLVLALLDPRWGFQYEEVERRGLDCFFVVDVSRSMLAEDASPNRLERAKAFIEDGLEALAGDRVGLIAYAGSAAIRCPLTLNHDLLRMAVAELGPESAPRGGSMLGDAIRLAGESFSDTAPGGKVIVVIADGEDQDSFPVEAAAKVHGDLGVRIFTVGIGDAREGARIPVDTPRGRQWLMHEGREVWTRMDERTLREVAAVAGGTFFPAGTRTIDMQEALERSLADLDRFAQQSTTIRRSTPRFQWFAGLALILLVAESLLSDRRGGWLGGRMSDRGRTGALP